MVDAVEIGVKILLDSELGSESRRKIYWGYIPIRLPVRGLRSEHLVRESRSIVRARGLSSTKRALFKVVARNTGPAVTGRKT